MEHEIIGHTKKALKAMHDPKKTLTEKLKEILIEVLIIVFAVTFAAFIERTRENNKEDKEAKEFVLGLKSDIKNEIDQLQQSQKDLNKMRDNYTKVMQLKSAAVDSLEKKNVQGLFNISSFNTNIVNGRYDGFKSSGKIQTIENDSLRKHILEFYQEDVPALNLSEGYFNNNQRRIIDLLVDHADENSDKPNDVMKLLTSTKGKLIIEISLGYAKNVENDYNDALTDAKKIQAEIDSEYQ